MWSRDIGDEENCFLQMSKKVFYINRIKNGPSKLDSYLIKVFLRSGVIGDHRHRQRN